MNVTDIVKEVRSKRDKPEAVRDAIADHRDELSEEDLQTLFEAGFGDVVLRLAHTTRDQIFDAATYQGGPLMSAFNEYGAYMELAERVLDSENTNFSRPANSFANEVAEANNPIGALYSILRKQKGLSDSQMTSVLEAAFPLATNGLDEETRDYLYRLASERGVTPVEVANVYGELVDLVTAIRFVEDES